MTTGTHSDSMKNLLAMGKLASMVHSHTSGMMDNNPIGLIRQILANNNGSIGVAPLASEVNRRLGIPECLDTQTARIRSIMAIAHNYHRFFKIEGENVKYVITSSREKLWRTAASFEEFAQYADKNNGFPHPEVDSDMNDLKVFMRSNDHAEQFVNVMTGNIPKHVATVAFSVVVAALLPVPSNGGLPGWLKMRVQRMIDLDDMDLLERITCTLVNMNAIFFDTLAVKQPSIDVDLHHTQVDIARFYQRIPELIDQIRAALEKPKKADPTPVAPSEPAEDQTHAPDPVGTSHIGADAPREQEQEQIPQTVSMIEMPIMMVDPEEGVTSEQAYHVRNELMTAYREMVADMSSYISGYRGEAGQTAIDHIRKVARLGLNLDLSEHSDDALESFMLFGNPDSVGTNLFGGLMLANHLRLATRLAYIFN